MELIYLDNAATTRTDERVVEAMLPYFTQYYGNASTIYALGEESRKAVTRARDIIAAGIGAKPEEIYCCLIFHWHQSTAFSMHWTCSMILTKRHYSSMRQMTFLSLEVPPERT